MSKFYPLDINEWVRACHELTPSEKDVLYYLRATDPYSNGIRINAAEIARTLSSPKHTVHRQTISRALKSLEVKGFIDLEILEANAKVLSRGKLSSENHGVSPHHQLVENGCVITPSVSHRTTIDLHTPQAIVTHHATSEIKTEKEFQEPKISKTYKEDQIDRSNFDLRNENQMVSIELSCLESVEDLVKTDRELPVHPENSGNSRSSPAPSDDREILEFIIKTTRQRGVELANPHAYARKCLQQNGEHWRSLFAASSRPVTPREYIDPWQVETSITLAIRMGDLDFVKAKIENLRQRGENFLVDRMLEKFGGALCT